MSIESNNNVVSGGAFEKAQVDLRKREALKKLTKLGAVSGLGATTILMSARTAAASTCASCNVDIVNTDGR